LQTRSCQREREACPLESARQWSAGEEKVCGELARELPHTVSGADLHTFHCSKWRAHILELRGLVGERLSARDWLRETGCERRKEKQREGEEEKRRERRREKEIQTGARALNNRLSSNQTLANCFETSLHGRDEEARSVSGQKERETFLPLWPLCSLRRRKEAKTNKVALARAFGTVFSTVSGTRAKVWNCCGRRSEAEIG